MPCWSKEELIAAREYVYPELDEKELCRRYYLLGGVVRGVLTSYEQHVNQFKQLQLKTHSEHSSFINSVKKVSYTYGSTEANLGDVQEYPHRIFHYGVNSERFKVERIFIASEWLKKRLAYRKRDEIRREYVENKKTIPPFSQSALGNLFERFVIGMWSISTKDRYHELYIKNKSGDIIGRCGTIPVGVMYKTPSDLIRLIKDKIKTISDYGSDYTHILLPSIEQYPALDFVVFDCKVKQESSNQNNIVQNEKEITLTLIQTTINAAKKGKRCSFTI
eukprot:TRINITY_DN18833_c0_g2_i2.p1 TRINITY_DN18833_c0_g2~~TRINITY_DN18833_c0_g2_i2.p1  ORF type:complete len:314 (+),score=-2.98 TRINITY_DN18833_c0_g2_i2:112-942(+)